MEHRGVTPRIFISYSHDTNTHREHVLSLSEQLRKDGIETCLDQYVNGTPAETWPRWMLNQIDRAEFILLVCTETYYRRFRGHEEPGKGKGVDWEGSVITQEIYDDRSATIKFVPVLFDATDERFIPEPVRGHTFYVLNSEQNYQALYDFLLGQAGVEPGPIGEPKWKTRVRATPTASEPVANAQREISAAERADRLGHLIHLCDREDVRAMFIQPIRDRIKLAKPAGGILCILPGGTREGHRGFLECVRDYEMRNQMGVTPEQVVVVPVFGKLPLSTVETLGISILRGIREGLQRPKLESWPDLQRWMSSEQRRIFILALEPTSDAVRGKECLFLANAEAWLSGWLDRPARQVFVLVACVRYAGGADAGELASERKRIERELAAFTQPEPEAPLAPEIVRLPELPSITAEDINFWLDHPAVKPLFGTRFKATLRQLFVQRPSWSMDDLRDQLDTPD